MFWSRWPHITTLTNYRWYRSLGVLYSHSPHREQGPRAIDWLFQLKFLGLPCQDDQFALNRLTHLDNTNQSRVLAMLSVSTKIWLSVSASPPLSVRVSGSQSQRRNRHHIIAGRDSPTSYTLVHRHFWLHTVSFLWQIPHFWGVAFWAVIEGFLAYCSFRTSGVEIPNFRRPKQWLHCVHSM